MTQQFHLQKMYPIFSQSIYKIKLVPIVLFLVFQKIRNKLSIDRRLTE